ncbi:unnamed protein product, partial [Brassica oleracea]
NFFSLLATNALNSSCYKQVLLRSGKLAGAGVSSLLFALLPCLFHGFLAQICEWVKGGHRRSGLDLGARKPDPVVILLAWSDGEVWERRGGEESAFRFRVAVVVAVSVSPTSWVGVCGLFSASVLGVLERFFFRFRPGKSLLVSSFEWWGHRRVVGFVCLLLLIRFQVCGLWASAVS